MKPSIAHHTQRLVFRTIEKTDTDLVISILGDPVTNLLSAITPPVPFGISAADKFIESTSPASINVFVCLPVSPAEPTVAGEVIGYLNLAAVAPRMVAHRVAAFAITLRAGYRGLGYGSEALEWLLDMGFMRFGLHKIEGGTWGFNEDARRLYKEMGFVEEGVKRKQIWMEGEWCDGINLGILEDEWIEWKAAKQAEREAVGRGPQHSTTSAYPLS